MAIRIEVQSERGTSHDPATVLVYEDKILVGKVVARIEPKQGADGGWYDCVVLEKVDLKPPLEAKWR